jgi:hypothetical protein
MLKVHRIAARKEIETLLMGTRSSTSHDMNYLAWEIFGVKDQKRRILDVDSPGMSQVVKEARDGDVLFESSTSESTILKDGLTAAQAELWKFFGKYLID